MTDQEKALRQAARRLLEEGAVNLVIGYAWGTLPLRTTPFFARTPEEADRLIYNSLCEHNLVKYLPRYNREKVGIVVKGCDARSLAGLLRENQLQRDRVHIIGVPCDGVIDRRKVMELMDGQEITAAEVDEERIVVRGDGFEQNIKKDDIVCVSCLGCKRCNPALYDTLVGDGVKAAEENFDDIRKFEALPSSEREAYFEREMCKCLRCYACRNACPMCYCKECFVDSSRPQWLSRRPAPADNLFFHLGRAFHLAGRCVDCGACARACPVGVDLTKLNRKIIKDAKDLFGYEAGLDPDQRPLLSSFDADDPETFILGE